MKINNLRDKLFKELDRNFWLRHGLFWIVIEVIIIPNLIKNNSGILALIRDTFLYFLLNVLIAYVLLYAIIPLIWKKNHIYVVIYTAIWIIISLFINYAHRYFIIIPVREGENSTSNITYHKIWATGGYIVAWAFACIAAAIKLFRHWYKKEKENQELLHENTLIELELLKAQIHPHFLFNTLNNVYALTLKQSDKAPDMLKRLSGLLHYMVEDCNIARISISQEIILLKNYISLEQLRYGTNLKIKIGAELTYHFENEKDLESKKIAPLLLLPFIENAFKHGSSQQLENAQIFFDIKVNKGILIFFVQNSKNPLSHQSDSSNVGTGLKNVKRRLQIIYPECHDLSIISQRRLLFYKINLTTYGLIY